VLNLAEAPPEGALAQRAQKPRGVAQQIENIG
jgi:hypothetical protein